MATIILAKDGVTLQELPLLKTRITIGRRTYNDIVIDAPGISAEHAVIITTPTESYFEDLGSTNGSRLNGQPVKKHLLQGRDVIELATHTIQYRIEDSVYSASSIVVPSEEGEPGASRYSVPPSNNGSVTGRSIATIKVLSGVAKDKVIALTKVLTTIGRPGVQVAVLTRGAEGYGLTHVEGDIYPLVNGVSIGMQTHPLKHGDVIALSGSELMFLY